MRDIELPISKPSDGLFCLHPFGRVNETTAGRMRVQVVRTPRLAVVSAGKIFRARDLKQARTLAIDTLTRAEIFKESLVAHNGIRLWRRLEIIDWANEVGDADLVDADSGALIVTKALSYGKLVEISAKLSAGLRSSDWIEGRKALDAYLDTVPRNLADLSEAQQEKALQGAAQVIKQWDTSGLTQTWKTRVNAASSTTFATTRQVIKNAYLPQVRTAYGVEDKRALEGFSKNLGFFITDQYGLRADRLTAIGMGVVSSGMSQGLSSREIADQLAIQATSSWGSYSKSYARAVAGAAVSRARGYSEITGYEESGITAIEIQAVLDELTCDICRAMDGRVVSVESAGHVMRRGLNVATPENVRTATPFMEIGYSGPGNKYVGIRGGPKVAEVTASAYGQRDSRGSYAFQMSTEELAKHGISAPPFHFLCRCWTVPRGDLPTPKPMQVTVTQPVPVVPPVTPPRPVRVPTVPRTARPAVVYPEPSPSKPLQFSPLPEPVAAVELTPAGIGDAERVVMPEVSKLYEEASNAKEVKAVSDEWLRDLKMGKKIRSDLVKEDVRRDDFEPIALDQNSEKAQRDLAKDAMAYPKTYGLKKKEIRSMQVRAMSKDEVYGLVKDLLGMMSAQMRKAFVERMPPIFVLTHPAHPQGISKASGSHWRSTGGRAQRIEIMPRSYWSENDWRETLWHELGHHMDTLGRTGRAAVNSRNRHIRYGRKIHFQKLPGDWIEPYDATIVGAPKLHRRPVDANNVPGDIERSEWTSQIMGRMSGKKDTMLTRTLRELPDQMAHALNVLKGLYL